MPRTRVVDIGDHIGRLTILREAGHVRGSDGSCYRRVECRCDCGNTFVTRVKHIQRRHTQSCGCLQLDRLRAALCTHGLTDSTPLYRVWHGMKRRCTNPSSADYANYAGRGISVCERWERFENFYEDMNPSYFRGATIERKDVNGNYEPDNVIWITKALQSRNRRNVPLYEYRGSMQTIPEIARAVGLSPATLRQRLHKYRMPFEVAIVPTQMRQWRRHYSATAA